MKTNQNCTCWILIIRRLSKMQLKCIRLPPNLWNLEARKFWLVDCKDRKNLAFRKISQWLVGWIHLRHQLDQVEKVSIKVRIRRKKSTIMLSIWVNCSMISTRLCLQIKIRRTNHQLLTNLDVKNLNCFVNRTKSETTFQTKLPAILLK